MNIKKPSIYDDLAGSVMTGYGIGDWHLQLETGELYWGPITKQIHEVSADYQPTLETALNFYPEDTADGRPLIEAALQHTIASGEPWEVVCRFVTAKGRPIWVRSVGQAITDSSGKVAVIEGFFQDISAYQRTQLEAQEYKKELLHLSNAVNRYALISMTNLDGTIVYVNDNFVEVSGYSRQELIGSSHSIISSKVHDRSFWEHLWTQISSSKSYRTEICNRAKDGSHYWVDAAVVPYVDNEGRIERYASIAMDITNRKRIEIEREQLESNLFQMQKMEALGQLTGGIAHDFNNMLAVSSGYAALLQQALSESDNPIWKKYADKIVASNERQRELIAKLLTFSRGGKQQNNVLCISEVTRNFEDLIKSVIPKTIEVEFIVSDDKLCIVSNETDLTQILMNLAINARDSMPESGKLTVEVKPQNSNQGQLCSSCRSNFEGDFVSIRVSDTGSGIADTIVDQIFDPFFTTKDKTKGSGMGLSVVHGIVHSNQGHLVIQTSNKGTTFEVLLPVAIHKIHEPQKPGIELDDNRLLHKAVAVLDDQVAVAELVSIYLNAQGAKTEIYQDPLKLLHDIATGQQHFDLVITDMAMPHCSGLDFINRLRTFDTQTPVIAMSGYSEVVTNDNYREQGFDAFVMKPVLMEELYKTIEQCFTEIQSTSKNALHPE